MERKIETEDLGINKSYFGPMLKYIEDDNVTDIEWNGLQMKIESLVDGPMIVEDKLSEEFCEIFGKRVADSCNESWNDDHPKLEAETSTLRITIMRSNIALTGTNINLRKIEAKVRMDNKSIITSGYCNEVTQKILKSLILSHCSGVLTGGTGTGKTELLKYLAQWIPNTETVLTLEDTNELKLYKIYPNKFIRPTIINRHYSWTDGIDYALRCNGVWLLMAEARGSEEVLKVFECVSTGLTVITCIHSKDVRQVPDRVDNMIGAGVENTESKENDLFTFFDFGIKIKKVSIAGSAPHRYIEQLCIYERSGKSNIIHMIVEDGELTGVPLPDSLLHKMKQENVENPMLGYETLFQGREIL